MTTTTELREDRGLDLKAAAEIVGLSEATLRKAIRLDVDTDKLPRLKAKKLGNRQRVRLRDLWEWFDRLPDA